MTEAERKAKIQEKEEIQDHFFLRTSDSRDL